MSTTAKALNKIANASARITAPRGFESRSKLLHQDLSRALQITPPRWRDHSLNAAPLPSAAIPFIP